LPLLAELRERAKAEGLLNVFFPVGHDGPYAERHGTRGGAGLSNVDYTPMAEAMGRSFIAPARAQTAVRPKSAMPLRSGRRTTMDSSSGSSAGCPHTFRE
jgi:hypothetical protein